MVVGEGRVVAHLFAMAFCLFFVVDFFLPLLLLFYLLSLFVYLIRGGGGGYVRLFICNRFLFVCVIKNSIFYLLSLFVCYAICSRFLFA